MFIFIYSDRMTNFSFLFRISFKLLCCRLSTRPVLTFRGQRAKVKSFRIHLSFRDFLFSVERMTCVAKWKEGNKRYFVALVSSRQSKWLEHQERYQCFLYEDISNKMKMAQGQFTSSCQGLWSVLEGSRTFSLEKCKPNWITLLWINEFT